MKKLILVTGDLATGKSTFARMLSERYQANVFIKDTIKEVLGDTIGFANREENLKLSKATMELMLFLFTEFAKLNKPLILEANFRQEEMNRIQDLAASYGYDVLTLVFRGEVEILHQRYLNRANNENRHPVHLSVVVDKLEDFKNIVSYGRNVAISGNVIEVDANDFEYQKDAKLFSKIEQFMQGIK